MSSIPKKELSELLVVMDEHVVESDGPLNVVNDKEDRCIDRKRTAAISPNSECVHQYMRSDPYPATPIVSSQNHEAIGSDTCMTKIGKLKGGKKNHIPLPQQDSMSCLTIHRSHVNMKTDTIMGRRGFNSTIFSDLIQEWTPKYEKAKQSARRAVAIDCMRRMLQCGCRFLVLSNSPALDRCTESASSKNAIDQNNNMYVLEEDSEKVTEKIVRCLRRNILQRGLKKTSHRLCETEDCKTTKIPFISEDESVSLYSSSFENSNSVKQNFETAPDKSTSFWSIARASVVSLPTSTDDYEQIDTEKRDSGITTLTRNHIYCITGHEFHDDFASDEGVTSKINIDDWKPRNLWNEFECVQDSAWPHTHEFENSRVENMSDTSMCRNSESPATVGMFHFDADEIGREADHFYDHDKAPFTGMQKSHEYHFLDSDSIRSLDMLGDEEIDYHYFNQDTKHVSTGSSKYYQSNPSRNDIQDKEQQEKSRDCHKQTWCSIEMPPSYKKANMSSKSGEVVKNHNMKVATTQNKLKDTYQAYFQPVIESFDFVIDTGSNTSSDLSLRGRKSNCSSDYKSNSDTLMETLRGKKSFGMTKPTAYASSHDRIRDMDSTIREMNRKEMGFYPERRFALSEAPVRSEKMSKNAPGRRSASRRTSHDRALELQRYLDKLSEVFETVEKRAAELSHTNRILLDRMYKLESDLNYNVNDSPTFESMNQNNPKLDFMSPSFCQDHHSKAKRQRDTDTTSSYESSIHAKKRKSITKKTLERLEAKHKLRMEQEAGCKVNKSMYSNEMVAVSDDSEKEQAFQYTSSYTSIEDGKMRYPSEESSFNAQKSKISANGSASSKEESSPKRNNQFSDGDNEPRSLWEV